MLLLAENDTGKTLIGLDPLFGLDASEREGTRSVGPFIATWFVIFMIPFFLWVREPRQANRTGGVSDAMRDLKQSLRGALKRRSLLNFLVSSMFYRDALNGMYTFGGIFALGVLNWSIIDTGIFGILAILSGAVAAWFGGFADDRFGPKPVIRVAILALTAVAICVVFVSRDAVFGIAVEPSSRLPDITFYIFGAIIGAAGGVIQAASRSMMVRQAQGDRMAEAFGLYALSGKATSFIAPLSVGVVTGMTGSQQLGVTPLIVLFQIGRASCRERV